MYFLLDPGLNCPVISVLHCAYYIFENMAEENIESLLLHLSTKVKQELDQQNIYEALQYVQSFIARKKKIMGSEGVSSAVFTGARLLLQASSIDPAVRGNVTGSLLKWFIEEGAGADHPFRLLDTNGNAPCDTANLLELVNGLNDVSAGTLVSMVYNPIHLLLARRKLKVKSLLQKRVKKLETFFANAFLNSKQFLAAFKSFSRLEEAQGIVETLKRWSAEGYASEVPLFFGRALLTILAEGKVSLAAAVLQLSTPFVPDNIGTALDPSKGGGALSSSLAVYHVSVILTDLAGLPPHDRVNKPRLFVLLFNRYGPLIQQLDLKLFEALVRTGELLFNFESPERQQQAQAPSGPFAMLQQMMRGGVSPPPAGGGSQVAAGGGRAQHQQQQPPMDFNAMMRVLSSMNQQK